MDEGYGETKCVGSKDCRNGRNDVFCRSVRADAASLRGKDKG